MPEKRLRTDRTGAIGRLLAGFYPNPFGRAAFIMGLANDVTVAAGAVVEVVVCPVSIRPTATGAATS